ncbi:MAG: hypothetical protein JSR46_09100, partial [Verrucomicrobia bacterium]|nr:hypothetical protein [Verrucomicrobiota bacterium]
MSCLEKITLTPCSDRELEVSSSEKEVEDILSKVALEALNALEDTLLHTAIIVGKIVLIPLELGCIALLVTARAITILFYPKGAEEELFTLPNILTALLNDLIEALRITYDFGNAPECERLKSTDDAGKGPQYIVIQPEHPSQVTRPIIYAPGYLDQAETLRKTC